jgi:hypothetical protein
MGIRSLTLIINHANIKTMYFNNAQTSYHMSCAHTSMVAVLNFGVSKSLWLADSF